MSSPAPSSLRRDIISAYIASGAKIASWAIVSAVVYRCLSPYQFATLSLVRGSVGILAYASLGLAPALVRMLTETGHCTSPPPAPGADRVAVVYSSGVGLARLSAACGLGLLLLYAAFFESLHGLRGGELAFLMGTGVLLRLVSDPAGAILQTSGRISTDNLILAGVEIAWAILSLASVWIEPHQGLHRVGGAFAISGAFVLLARRQAVRWMDTSVSRLRPVRWDLLQRLLSFGLFVTFAQLADFLYAPANYILINGLLSPLHLADYAPLVQIDAALLVLVSGLASVLLPRSALAHAAGDSTTVRQYYVRGTLASAALLAAAATAVWLLAPFIFPLWLGNPMPATQAILPLVLIHTVIGGSSAVGRSILLGMGKVKPFTIAALSAGVANVMLAFVFVKYLNLGLRGVVYATILVVTARCAVWMPWYVTSSLRRSPDPVREISPLVEPPL